jgi:cytochrome c553
VKNFGFQLSLQTAIVVTTLVVAHRGAVGFSQQDLQAKIEYCKTCHGLSGQGYRGSSPMPRLAGQQTEYFENQLRAFIEHRRENKLMSNVARVLSPAMLTPLASHFSDLNPRPLGGAPKELVAAGKKLYEKGVPGRDLESCSSCHGPEAKGKGESPRLAGQLHDYTVKTLVNWSKERGQDPAEPDSSAIMKPIAHSLTEAQVSAIAAYVSELE